MDAARPVAPSPPLAAVVGFFESISPQSVERIGELYAPDAVFKDPFNEVTGVPEIRRIFLHMFEQVRSPRFVVHETIEQGDAAMLTWDFAFAFPAPLSARPRLIRGCTHLRFDGRGRILLHRDYWDAAEELYEQLPVLGAGMRWLRRRMSAPR